MKENKASRTALKVAAGVAVAGQHTRWSARLPEGSAAITRELLAASGHRMWEGELPYRFAESRMGKFAIAKNADIYEGLVARKAFINRHVLEAIDAGATQVVVVGAGFDTLCLRLAPEFPDVRFVEVDHPATAPPKHEGIRRVGQPSNLELVVADLGRRKLSTALPEASSWDRAARSVFVAEGLLMYLSPEQIEDLSQEVRRCSGAKSRLLVTHLTDLNVAGRFSRLWVRLIGEPWLSAHTRSEFRTFAERMGWTVLEQDEPRVGRNLEGFAALESP